MTDDTTTTKENKAGILADLWLNYKNDNEFKDFLEYNDLGLPLAFAYAEGIIESNETVDRFINETFDLLLSALDIGDTGFTTLNEMFIMSDTEH